MSRLLIEPVTPEEPGYIALKAESIASNFNMLRRLEENWQRGENRFNAPGEKLLGAFLNGKLVGVCGLNRDPFSQQPRAGRIRHLYVSEKCRGLGIGKQLLTVVMADASIWLIFSIPTPRTLPTGFIIRRALRWSRMNHGSHTVYFARCDRLAASGCECYS